jgi:hypothetical protein
MLSLSITSGVRYGTLDAIALGKKTCHTFDAGKERAMRTVSTTLLSLLITAGVALAAGGGAEGEGLSMMATLFIAFGVLIVMFQFIPGIMLLVGMLRGIFSASENKTHETTVKK